MVSFRRLINHVDLSEVLQMPLTFFTQNDFLHMPLLRLIQNADRFQEVSLKLKRLSKGKTGCNGMRVSVEKNTRTHHRSSHSRSSGSHRSSDRSSLNPLAICRSFSANHSQSVIGKCRTCLKPKEQMNIGREILATKSFAQLKDDSDQLKYLILKP